MIKVQRAHKYQHVTGVKNELLRVPRSWMESIAFIDWFILPDTLSPLWIGLMAQEEYTHDGRKYSECGGWYFDARYDGSFLSFIYPHIYLAKGHAWAVVHEVAHALEAVWSVPIEDFYRPERSFYKYMAANETEYFACALDAYLRPTQDEQHWNRADVAVYNPNLYAYLNQKESN